MGLFDRRQLPADVRESLRLHLGGDGTRKAASPRVLAWAETPGGYLVALPDRLATLTRPDSWESLPWERLASATWDNDGTMFGWRTTDRAHHLQTTMIAAPGRLPEVVRERVERTFVARHEVVLQTGAPVTVTGRRPAEGDGAIVWSVVGPRGLRLDSPEHQRAAADAIAQARRHYE